MKKFLAAFNLLSPKARTRFYLLIPVILLGMCLEVLSVGMIVPALGILMDESYFERFKFFGIFSHSFAQASHAKLIFLGLGALAVAFLLKNLYLFFQVYCQGTFVYSAKREIALNLFRKYLYKNYLYHLRTNSSIMLRNLTTEVNSYCSFFLMPVVNLITETLVIISIISLIVWFEPLGSAFLIFVLGLLTISFVKASNRVVGSWGKERLVAEEKKFKHLQQGFGAIKQILLSGKKEFFLRRFHEPNQVAGLMDKREYIFQYVPKLGVETIAVGGLVLMCCYLLWCGKPFNEVTYMLGLMASAGFRLIPSFSRILNNIQSLRYGWASVDTLLGEFFPKHADRLKADGNEVLSAENGYSLKFENKIEFFQVSFSYENHRQVLDCVNFSISKGSIVGLTGPSGSGKSTVADLLLGLVSPSSGALLVDDQKLFIDQSKGWLAMIGYVPQEVSILDDSIRRNIAFGLYDDEINDDRIWEVLGIVNLQDFVRDEVQGLDTSLGERGAKMSGGQKQRLGVARALYHDPDILILDEFTSALDRGTEKEVLDTFRPLIGKKTILIISHSDAPLSLCDQVYRLENAKIELLNSNEFHGH